MKRHTMTAISLASLALAGCSDDDFAVSPNQSDPWIVTAKPKDFDTRVDNPFYPLPVGAKWTYATETDDGLEVIVVEVLPETKDVAWGVTATVVRDTVTLDGVLIEDTFDWFAQDKDGNAWYFGEDTCAFEDDVCVDKAGSWEAGVDGALPGIAMLALPKRGDMYYQEFFRDVAEDFAEVESINASAEVPVGSFTGCVRTRDTTSLEPNLVELKTYCGGLGLVLEEEEDTRVELQELTGLGTL